MNAVLCSKSKIPIKCCNAHSHIYWEIVLHLSGTATVVIGGCEYSASAGDIMVIPPNIEHSNFSDGYYTDMFMQAESLDFSGVVFTHDTNGNVSVLMNMLYRTLIEKEFHYSNIADNLTDTICAYINKLSGSDLRYPFVNNLKNVIYDNLSNADFDLTEEIAASGYNPIYLRRCFKEVIGKPPLEYMTAMRINQAKTLLTQSTFVSVKNTASSCGFDDSLYFSVCFKKHTGYSPLQYRKKYFSK